MKAARESVTIFIGGHRIVDYREILRYDSLGYSRKQITLTVHSSHHTVEDTLNAAKEKGITWPLDEDICPTFVAARHMRGASHCLALWQSRITKEVSARKVKTDRADDLKIEQFGIDKSEIHII